MSKITLHIESSSIANKSGFSIYYATPSLDGLVYTELKNNGIFYPTSTGAMFVTDENKNIVFMAQTKSYTMIYGYKVYGGIQLSSLDRYESFNLTIDEILFEDSTCTKTTAHLTPQFVT